MPIVNVQMPPELALVHSYVTVAFDEGVDEAKDTDIINDLADDVFPDDKTGVFGMIARDVAFMPEKGSLAPDFEPTVYQYLVEVEPAVFRIKINEDEIEDDKYGAKIQYSKQAGMEAAKRRSWLLRYGILSGLTKLTYDGLAFFATNHAVDPNDASKGTYSNKLSVALTDVNYRDAKAAMRKFPDESGRARNNTPSHLIVPPELEAKAREIVALPTVNAGGANPDYDPDCKIVVVPEFAATEWIVAAARGPQKPWGYFLRTSPKIRYEGTDNSASRTDHLWKARVRDALAFLRPYKAIYSKP